MLRIFITRQSRYPADTKMLKKRIRDMLGERGVQDAQVSVALVGVRKMKELSKRFLEEENVHEVLSFPGGEFFPAANTLSLGDVVICYPEARRIAAKRNRMVDDVIGELAEHGMLHLLGIHHE